MRIVTVRRISQAFFLLMLLWMAMVTTPGDAWWRRRAWPVNWLLDLDPLTAVGTVLTTGKLYAGLAWAVVVIVLTIFLGRFFCGWVCPLGTIQQAVGWLGRRGRVLPRRIAFNQYHRGQSAKYYVLLFLLAAASGGALAWLVRAPQERPLAIPVAALAGLTIIALLTILRVIRRPVVATVGYLVVLAAVAGLGLVAPGDLGSSAMLLTGLADPIPLTYRSVSLALLAVAESAGLSLSPGQRWYELSWLIGGVFLAVVLLNLAVPRFYCRFVCPLGAMLGVLNRWSIWRIGKRQAECVQCKLCEADCEGACSPSGKIRISECVLCMNCLDACKHNLISYQRPKSATGEVTSPDISRRGVLASLATGLLAAPLLRLGAATGANYSANLIRPPGALEEEEFLRRCIKCGQCMRICPSNVLQPAGLDGGLEALWTPVLNNRIGSSGCQLNCNTCGSVCPTAAIRPISLDERLGRGEFAPAGPIRLGTAFLDRNRCLPWAMDRPCIVCQENCPVSPKAIFVREYFSTIRDGKFVVEAVSGATMELINATVQDGAWATGDYYCRAKGNPRLAIVANGADSITVAGPWRTAPPAGSEVEIQVRLQQPYVDPRACVGCGICEHECPVSGLRAIRVTAENESRNAKRILMP